MEKLEKTFEQYLDIRVGSGVRKKIETARKEDGAFNANVVDALRKTFDFYEEKGWDEVKRDAMFDAQDAIKLKLEAALGLERYQVDRVFSAMTLSAAEIAQKEKEYNARHLRHRH